MKVGSCCSSRWTKKKLKAKRGREGEQDRRNKRRSWGEMEREKRRKIG